MDTYLRGRAVFWSKGANGFGLPTVEGKGAETAGCPSIFNESLSSTSSFSSTFLGTPSKDGAAGCETVCLLKNPNHSTTTVTTSTAPSTATKNLCIFFSCVNRIAIKNGLIRICACGDAHGKRSIFHGRGGKTSRV